MSYIIFYASILEIYNLFFEKNISAKKYKYLFLKNLINIINYNYLNIKEIFNK